jgi:hypothetical protein
VDNSEPEIDIEIDLKVEEIVKGPRSLPHKKQKLEKDALNSLDFDDLIIFCSIELPLRCVVQNGWLCQDTATGFATERSGSHPGCGTSQRAIIPVMLIHAARSAFFFLGARYVVPQHI